MIAAQPIQNFLPRLARAQEIRFAIQITYATAADQILAAIANPDPIPPTNHHLWDLIQDTAKTHSKPSFLFQALDEAGLFQIRIMDFGGIYWIQWRQNELGYFDVRTDAEDHIRKVFRQELKAFTKAAAKLKKRLGLL